MGIGAHYNQEGKLISFILDIVEVAMVHTWSHETMPLTSRCSCTLAQTWPSQCSMCYGSTESRTRSVTHTRGQHKLTIHKQAGKIMANGASNNDTMSQVLIELIDHFQTSDRGHCLSHVLHLEVAAMHI